MDIRKISQSLLLLLSMIILITSCQKDDDGEEMEDEEEEEVIFEFPNLTYVDSLVYQEMINTCESKWDLSLMEESTFTVVVYIDKYVVNCVGVDGNRYYWFLIEFDLEGNVLSEGKKDYLGRGTYFDVVNMEGLKLDSIRNFWKGSFVTDIDSTKLSQFRNSPGFIDDHIRIDESGNTITFSVFNTKDDAVKAMDAKAARDSCTVVFGNSQALPGFWWFQECGLYNAVYVNRWNTIFEVGRNNPEFKVVEDTLYITGNEIERRVRLLLD